MSDKQNPAEAPASNPTEPTPPTIPIPPSGAQALPNVMPGAVNVNAAALFQQQLNLQRMILSNTLPKELLDKNPALAQYAAVIRQQALTAQRLQGIRPFNLINPAIPGAPQAGTAAAAAAAAAATTTTATRTSSRIKSNATAAAAAAPTTVGLASTSAITSTYPPRKRKSEATLPEKHYQILPESPLFVELQDIERKVDAACNRKRSEMAEIGAAPAVGCPMDPSAAGNARKRLRIYVYSEHFNQPGSGIPSFIKTPEPPAWCLTITGRLVDGSDDSSHPGGGGTTRPGLQTPKKHFSSYVKKIRVKVDKEKSPGYRGRSSFTWEKAVHDREPVDSIQIRHAGDRQVHVNIELELDYMPQLFIVPKEVERLLGLPSGPAGGLYSVPYVVSAMWMYVKNHNLFVPGSDRTAITFDDALCAAFGIDAGSAKEKKEPQNFNAIQDAVYKIVKLPPPIKVEHTVLVDGATTSPFVCIDAHMEVPVVFPDGEIPALRVLKEKLEQKLENLDRNLATYLGQIAERKRRFTLLSAFSVDPYSAIHEIILAQQKVLRVSGDHECMDVMNKCDVYKEKWVQDAVLKYLTEKQTADHSRQMIQAQMIQSQQKANAAAILMLQQQQQAAMSASGVAPKMEG